MPRKRDGQAADLSRRVRRAFGRRLAAARSNRRFLQQDLGERLNLSRTSVSNLECGTRAVFLDQLYRAAHILGVDVLDLLPTMNEVFPPVTVHTAVDDQVPEEQALTVLKRIEQKLEVAHENRSSRRNRP